MFVRYSVHYLLPQDLVCSVTDISEPKGAKANTVRVAVTVTELLRHHVPRQPNSQV